MVIKIKRGQVSILIIVAIVILAILLLWIVFSGERVPTILPGGKEINEDSFLGQCTKESVREVSEILLKNGGKINPTNYKMYNGSAVEFLCINYGFYEPCIQQHPMLVKEIENEIDRYITPMIEDCLNEMKSEIEKDGGELILQGGLEVDVDLGEDSVYIDIKKQMTFVENDVRREVDSLDFKVDSGIYNLAVVALEIAAQEAEYCYFEYVGFNAFYPRFVIRPFGTSDSVVVYQIEDKKFAQEMRIAVRSCAIPSGI